MRHPLSGLLLALSALLAAASSFAEGPGTRIRAGSDMPRLLDSLQRNASGPCDRQRGEARDRCLKEIRKATVPDRGTGPQSTGAGSGAGSGASNSGPSGAAAPR